ARERDPPHHGGARRTGCCRRWLGDAVRGKRKRAGVVACRGSAFGRRNHWGRSAGASPPVRQSEVRPVFLRHLANAPAALVLDDRLREPAQGRRVCAPARFGPARKTLTIAASALPQGQGTYLGFWPLDHGS